MTQPVMSESDWQGQVLDYARYMGWLCYHGRPAQDRSGHWSTPMQGDPGFPDWVFLRERVVWVELKVRYKKPTVAQQRWLDRLLRAGEEAYVWYPNDWPLVQAALKRPPVRIRQHYDILTGERL